MRSWFIWVQPIVDQPVTEDNQNMKYSECTVRISANIDLILFIRVPQKDSKHGADALRMFLVTSSLVRGENMRFRGECDRDVISRVRLPWLNFMYNPHAPVSTNVMDRWILGRCHSLIKLVKAGLQAYRSHLGCRQGTVCVLGVSDPRLAHKLHQSVYTRQRRTATGPTKLIIKTSENSYEGGSSYSNISRTMLTQGYSRRTVFLTAVVMYSSRDLPLSGGDFQTRFASIQGKQTKQTPPVSQKNVTAKLID
ncbi:hypothetical protein P692DRAFT_20881404 [Suillus brevipes Sb2]|nr:hypothetical protein P692DRAFT_20881404 [Suillus brevipes Sb2]